MNREAKNTRPRSSAVFFPLIPVVVFGLAVAMAVHPTAADDKSRALEAQLKKNPQDTKLLMELGIIYHGRAAEGDRRALRRADELFKTILTLEPDNAEARVWYGSTLTIKAREEWLPPVKLLYLAKGVQEMDKAVGSAPDNIVIRLVRAHTSLALPYIFGRTRVAIEDFEHLLGLSRERPEEFTPEVLAQIHLALGKAHEKDGRRDEARRNWEEVIEIAPDSSEALEAESLLKGG